MKRLLEDLLNGWLPTGAEEFIHVDVVSLGDDVRELFGAEDVVEPGKDGLLRPVLDAYTTGHVLDQVVLYIEV